MLRGRNTLLQTGRLTRKNPLADRGRVLTRLMPPRSTPDLPVSHYPKVHSADQLGPVCLCGFHVGTSLLQRLVFEPKTTVPPITAAIAPIRIVGSNPSAPTTIAKIKIPPAAMATF